MELVTDISVILIFLGIVDTTGSITPRMVSTLSDMASSVEVSKGLLTMRANTIVTSWPRAILTTSNIVAKLTSEPKTATTLASTSLDTTVGIAWSTQTMPMTAIGIETTSSATTNERMVSTADQKYGINITEYETALVSSTEQMLMNTPDSWQTMTPTASNVTTNQRSETSTGAWQIEWPEVRAGLIFGGVTIPLTVVITLLIIWKRGGSLYSCMRLGSRPKEEEEIIGLEQLKIGRNKSNFSARDLVIGSAINSTFQSSDDDEWEYDGYLHPIGTEVGNIERICHSATYPRRNTATNKNIRSGDRVESKYDEPHWNRHEVNVHSMHSGIEEDRTEYDIARSTPSPRMSRDTEYTVPSIDTNESEYDEAHPQHTGTEVDNTDYNIPGPTPNPRRSPTTDKNVLSGDASESEYDEPHWNRQEVNVHSVHTAIEMENTDYYNCRKFGRNEEEENPYANE